jgi:energy-coupling factor transport system ATP-binding protein
VILRIDRLTYTYPGTMRPALVDVSVQLNAGELVVVAGASGSGKSTLLRAVSGLVPHFHGGEIEGAVMVAGMDTREHSPGELASAVGTLFQDPETQVVMGTVRAELGFGLENRGESPVAVARAVEEAALALGIAHLLDRSTGELSGGELQRVALGAALAGHPALVVLDEPTSQLDPVAGDELIGLLRRINEDSDTTILLAEHRLERCLAGADRVLAMVDGRIACDAAPTDFLVWAAEAAPALQTPGARLLGALHLAPAAGVKAARAALRGAGVDVDGVGRRPAGGHPDGADSGGASVARRFPFRAREHGGSAPALKLERVWHELRGGATILRDVSLSIVPGEHVALMGRNGAGKSTLLRHAAGLMQPTRGRITTAGRIALLLQNPTDYLVHERVEQEASEQALARVGLDDPDLRWRHPRELSGGEKQRLALAIVLGDDAADIPAALLLDEPTRGMDRHLKDELAQLLQNLGTAVLVATHDPEFVAVFAQRVVLLADGTTIADGPTREVLTGGSYFVTETARILGSGALTPEQGAELLAPALKRSPLPGAAA